MINRPPVKVTIYAVLKFLLIIAAAFIFIQTSLVLIDIKHNGFTTLATNTTAVITSTNRHDYSFNFAVSDNYLGSISLPLTVGHNGNVQIKLKEKGAANWYYQGRYTTTGIQLLPLYPVGFPIIANSKNKQYQVVIEPSKSTKSASVFLSSKNITTKYSYPRSVLLHNKKMFVTFLVNKYFESISWATIFFSLILGIFFINPQKIIAKFRKVLKISISEIGQEKILKNIIPLFLFCFFFYSSLVQSNFSGALGWLVGFCLLCVLLLSIGEQLLFVVPIFFFVLFLISLFTGFYTFAEIVISLVWVFLFAGILQVFLNFFMRFLKSKETVYIKKWVYKIFWVIAFLAFLIAAIDKTYILGGDDSRVYFLYPVIYFQNFVASNGLNGGVSSVINSLPTTSMAQFAIFSIVLKAIFAPLNLQATLFVLNIIGGLVFFYVLIDYIFPGKRFEYFIARSLTSLFYVFSIFNFYTLFNSLLIAQFLISMFPLSMYLYIKGIKEKKYYLLCLCAIIWSVFSFVLISLPWFAAAFIAFIPVLVFLFWKEKIKFIILNILFGILLLLLNGYWIIAASSSSLSNSNISTNNSIVSAQYRNQNAQGITGTSQINKIFFPLVNLYHYDIQNNFRWPYLQIFTSWYLKLVIFNSVFIIFILWTGVKIKNNQFRKAYITCSLGFLLILYLFTVNIGNAGIKLFVFLTNYLPGFVMFRNMYDKFGYAMAFSFSLLLLVCLNYFLTSKINILYKRVVTIFFFFVILLNAFPFLTGAFYALPVWTTHNTYTTTTGFNHDYINLVSYVRNQSNPSRYLWIPLNTGNISQIQDENQKNHFYSGVSPLLLLSGKNDYSGLMSFGRIGSEIKKDMREGDYEQLGGIYQKYNVRYIIVNNTVSKDIKQSYICVDTINICNLQDSKYKKYFLGKKIKNFGSRYTLYEINPRFLNDTIYLTQNAFNVPDSSQQDIQYRKISNQEYIVNIKRLQQNEELVFLNLYFPNWKLYTQDNIPLPKSNHTKIFNYANGWSINKDVIISNLPKSAYIKNSDGSVSVTLRLKFVQNGIGGILATMAVLAYAAIFVYALIVLVKYKWRDKLSHESKKN